jgi:hypothetical protein
MAGCRWKRDESSDRADGVSRPVHVYDADGAHLGSFARWEPAHEWAHLQVMLGGLSAPLQVEDRRHGVHRWIWADHCTAVEPFRDATGSASAPAAAMVGSSPDAQGPSVRQGPEEPTCMTTVTTRTAGSPTNAVNPSSPPQPRRPD